MATGPPRSIDPGPLLARIRRIRGLPLRIDAWILANDTAIAVESDQAKPLGVVHPGADGQPALPGRTSESLLRVIPGDLAPWSLDEEPRAGLIVDLHEEYRLMPCWLASGLLRCLARVATWSHCRRLGG